MYSTEVFIYQQRQTVVLPSTDSERFYMPHYSKSLMLHRGVDNVIQFKFLNQEQRSVDITNFEINCRIISSDGTTVLLSKLLTITLPLTGIANLELSAADLADVEPQKCGYSLEFTQGGKSLTAYMDNGAGARGHITIVDSVFPNIVESSTITIPTGQVFPLSSANALSPACTYTSSVFSSKNNPDSTIQITYAGFTGVANIQGSSANDANWYTIATRNYANITMTDAVSFRGYHPYIRVEFISNCGVASNVAIR